MQPSNPYRRRYCLAAASLTSGFLPRLGQAETAPKIGDKIKLPAVITVDGKGLPATHWQGKVLILNKFATWCPFCRVMNPKIEKLYQKERGRGLEVLGLSIDRNPAEVPKYMLERKYTFPVAMWTMEWERALGSIKGLPIYWIIGRDGVLKQIESGELHDEDVAEFAKWL